MTCGQNCPARFGGKTIECGLSRGHDPRQPHLAVVAGQNVTWFNSEALTPKFHEQAFAMAWPSAGQEAAAAREYKAQRAVGLP